MVRGVGLGTDGIGPEQRLERNTLSDDVKLSLQRWRDLTGCRHQTPFTVLTRSQIRFHTNMDKRRGVIILTWTRHFDVMTRTRTKTGRGHFDVGQTLGVITRTWTRHWAR